MFALSVRVSGFLNVVRASATCELRMLPAARLVEGGEPTSWLVVKLFGQTLIRDELLLIERTSRNLHAPRSYWEATAHQESE
jgi:hypothetical protein